MGAGAGLGAAVDPWFPKNAFNGFDGAGRGGVETTGAGAGTGGGGEGGGDTGLA